MQESTRGLALTSVLNPAIGNQVAERLPLTPRLDTLENKTLYMVDINWGGPDAAWSVFRQIESWFHSHLPSLRCVLRRKKGGYELDDPELWEEIADQGDAAIVGISG